MEPSKRELRLVEDTLDRFYELFFPDSYVQRINGFTPLEGDLQKAGIDVIVHCQNIGQTFNLDEKIRWEDYGDILLEEYSKYDQRVPGWLEKNDRSDFIPYVIVPRGEVFMLPYPILRAAYIKNKETWLNEYGRRFAKNRGYRTSNIPVPWGVLKQSIWIEIKQSFNLLELNNARHP